MKQQCPDKADVEVQEFSTPSTVKADRSLPFSAPGSASAKTCWPGLQESLQWQGTKVLPAPFTNAMESDSTKTYQTDGNSQQQRGPGGAVTLKVTLGTVLCVCLAWTLCLGVLTVAPNAAVNRIMDTESFDDGAFWLIVDTPSPLRWIAVFGLSSVGLGYAFVLFILIFKRPRVMQGPAAPQRTVNFVKARAEKIGADAATDRKACQIATSAAKLAVNLSQGGTPARKRLNFCLKIGDLVIGTGLVLQALEAGMPVPLVGILTATVATYSVASIVTMFLPFERIGLVEELIDMFFDFLIAVGYPMLVLNYCLSTFTFDRVKMAINLAVFPPGKFDRMTSVIADPVQIDVIHKSLDSVRIMSTMEFFTRVGVNLLFCFRLYRIVGLIQGPTEHQRSSVYPKRNRASVTFFFLFVVLLVVVVEEGIRTSTIACQPHPECVVKAHRWTTLESDSLTQCPCLTLIDVDLAPKTYAEWMQPKNVTDKVAQLAATGDLQTIQLINRYLPIFPEELRRCRGMIHLSLIYTHTATMPGWVKELTQLHYLHVEGTASSSLESLPSDLFDDMKALTFFHLGGHVGLQRLPSFEGLTNLKSFSLAILLSLVELPTFDKLQHLERLVMSSLVRLDNLPDFAPLKKLTALTIADSGPWCCNGFRGDCDLSDPLCGTRPLWGTPAASCLPTNRTDKRPTAATLAALDTFKARVCGKPLLPGAVDSSPTEAGIAQCNGTLYKQCEMPGYPEAMCYNARYMAIACSVNPFPIEMRRRQIRQGVGDACHPEYEAWLGCQ